MTGHIIALIRLGQRGIIRGDDGVERPFRRAGLVFYGAFDDMKAGTLVRFDEEAGRAINVEIRHN
jgi:hypothetical protein